MATRQFFYNRGWNKAAAGRTIVYKVNSWQKATEHAGYCSGIQARRHLAMLFDLDESECIKLVTIARHNPKDESLPNGFCSVLESCLPIV